MSTTCLGYGLADQLPSSCDGRDELASDGTDGARQADGEGFGTDGTAQHTAAGAGSRRCDGGWPAPVDGPPDGTFWRSAEADVRDSPVTRDNRPCSLPDPSRVRIRWKDGHTSILTPSAGVASITPRRASPSPSQRTTRSHSIGKRLERRVSGLPTLSRPGFLSIQSIG